MSKILIHSEVTELPNNNKIIVKGFAEGSAQFEISNIYFKGKNNILFFCYGEVFSYHNKIVFKGSNALCAINKIYEGKISLNITLYNNSTFFLDKNCSLNGLLNCIISESKNILIGKDSMFSFGIWIRCSDAHLIYDIQTNKRINNSKDVYIGSHVWIGQSASLLKGATIGSGSVIGMDSTISTNVYCNTIVSGVPAIERRNNIHWDREGTHYYSEKETEVSQDYNTLCASKNKIIDSSNSKIFTSREDNTDILKEFSMKLSELTTESRLDFIKNNNMDDLIVKNT